MKGFRAISAPLGPTEGSLEGLDLSLMGLPPPMFQRPNRTSASKPIACSISVVMGSEPRRKAQEATGPGASRAIKNLRRSNSTTRVHQPQAKQAWTGPLRLAEPPDFLTFFEGSLGGKKKPASLSKASSKKGGTWNILDDQPKAVTLLPNAQSPSTLDALLGPWRRECTIPLAPNFTVNDRSNNTAVGNCVTTMVHNHYSPVDTASPKSSNHAMPSLNNLIKAATDKGEGSSFRNLKKNCVDSNHVAWNNSGTAEGLLRWREVMEEEAERFIHQVNQAAITIQRWYRHQSQQRRAHASSLEHLLASKRKGQQQRLEEGNLLDLHKHREAARRKAREEKARQARQAAVQELQQKQAQKSGDAEPELLKGTQETGKPRPAQETPPWPGGSVHQTHKANNKVSFCATDPEDPCQPVPNSSPEPQQFPEDKPQDASSQGMAGEALETVGPTGSRSKCKATLDELLDTLKLLEEEPEPLPCPMAYHKDRYTWIDKEDDASCLTADNLEKFGKFSTSPGLPEDGMLLSEAKLKSIMNFLDKMEKSGQDRLTSAPQGLMLEEGPGHSESTSEVSTCVMRLKLEVEEKNQALVLLQRALAQQQDFTVWRVKETEKELCQQLWQQREHYEATIQRHLSLIDQLIEDKKTLGEKCEAVVAKLKQGDQRCKEREAQIQKQHELEIKKLKELMSATEKVGREKWMKEKTRRIKEITVRGLELEIQKLIAKHKQEVKSLRSLHTAELLQADEQAAQRYRCQVEALREQLEQEKEALVQQEHEHAQRRFKQQLEREQQDLQQLRQRLYSEVAEEKERLGQQAARQWAELEELRQQLEEKSCARGQALRAELEKEREELEHRHQMELQALKDQMQVERQMWEDSCAKKEEAWLLNREQELREEIRRGRDKDIELVIRQLEADMTQAREESERATESRVKRTRDKYEVELLELEQSERKLQDQCAELKGRLVEAKEENACLQALVRQKDKALAEVKTMNEHLTSERSSLSRVLRQEFMDQLAASEEGNQKVSVELAELQACQQLELEQLRREKQAELEDVHRRVKLALAKKEEAMNSLRKQHEAVVKRANHLEELLEQHRQPLLSAK
ncbi:centrosomal protein of 131 kDa [Rhynchonycteris naso]